MTSIDIDVIVGWKTCICPKGAKILPTDRQTNYNRTDAQRLEESSFFTQKLKHF